MGGSGISGDVVQAIVEPRLPLPFRTIKSYGPLPDWIGPNTLVLAVYEHEARRNHAALQRALEVAPSPRAAVEIWIDAMLDLAFDSRRSRRTTVLEREGARLGGHFPDEFAAILAGAVQPLAA